MTVRMTRAANSLHVPRDVLAASWKPSGPALCTGAAVPGAVGFGSSNGRFCSLRNINDVACSRGRILGSARRFPAYSLLYPSGVEFDPNPECSGSRKVTGPRFEWRSPRTPFEHYGSLAKHTRLVRICRAKPRYEGASLAQQTPRKNPSRESPAQHWR